MKILTKFTSKSGKEILVIEPDMKFLNQITEFINRLAKEDTFLSFSVQKEISKHEEKNVLKNLFNQMKWGKAFSCWAIYDNKVIASSDIFRGGFREQHIGKISVMVDKEFREDGIGKFLIDFILEKAKAMKIKIVSLTVFSDNEIAIKLYKQFGFKEWGRLPNGLFRKNKYSDTVKMYKEISSFAKATEDKL